MMDQRLHAMSAQITKMTPQQRQKFAMLHKNDPILVGLTKFINDQEGALRNSLKVQQQGIPDPNGPKVVDDVISQMAPNGLASMPAPALEQMPGGGIAGPEAAPQGAPAGPPAMPKTFKHGGKVKGYAGGGITGGGVMGQMAPGQVDIDPQALEKALAAANEASMRMTGLPLSEDGKARIAARFKANPTRAQQMMVPAQKVDTKLAPAVGAMEKDRTPIIPPAPQAASVPGKVSPNTAPAQQVQQSVPMPRPPAMPSGGSGYSLPSMPNAPQFGAIDVAGEFKKGKDSLPSGPVAADEIKALNEQEVKGAERRREELKADQEAAGEFGTEREKRLKGREEKLNKQESENKGLALLDAGLAMMAGRSPHAMVNIGEGALVGTKRFREGQKMIDEGRERLDEAFSRLEEVRRSEKRADRSEMRAASADIDKAMNAGLARIIDGIGKREDVNTKTATAMLEGSLRDITSRREAEGRQFDTQMRYRGSIEGAHIQGGYGLKQAGISAGASNYAAQMRLKGDEIGAAARKAETQELKWTDLSRKVYSDVANEVKMEAQGINGLKYAENPALMEQEIARRAATRLKQMRVPESYLPDSSVTSGGGAADFVYDPKLKQLVPPR